MEERSKEGQVKQHMAGHSVSEHFSQIDPHRRGQYAPVPNSSGGFSEGKSKK